ncbi:MAG: serine/threonine-protein kinase [Desulfobacteraceae bacterium]|jgi:tRNA A-37 threonylcarbamoyl transferase component Bud32
MAANQKASTTMMWLKQLTTSTFLSINKRVDRVDFLRRNKKSLLLLLILWCAVVAAGYTGLQRAAHRQLDGFLTGNAAAAERLADQGSSPLLEDDALSLIRITSEFEKEHKVQFAAILNHENRIVAHSDPDLLNQPYTLSQGEMPINTIGQVSIASGKMANGKAVITFSRDITFSNVKIGSAVFGVPARNYFGIVGRYRVYKVLLFGLCTIAVAFGVIFADRRRKREPVRQLPVSGDGSRIGPYHLKEKIAQGGMAELFLSDYVRTDGFRRKVAIKKVLPNLAENQDFIKMFIREARLAALLQHPNIVQIFDFGKIQNTYFIAMEFIDGKTLGQVMAHVKAGLPIDMAVFLISKICLGLDYSHKRKDDETGNPLGIVHRDISPQNIMVSYQGEVKISDFGISKANTEPSLTQAGVIKGKLAYLSPEQALGQQVDHQADIYSLGLMFYEILTGSRIYQFDSDIEAIRTIPEMEIVPIKQMRKDIPDQLNEIVMKCLAKDKNERYQDAMTVHDDLVKLKATLNLPYDASDLSTYLRTTFDHA